MDPVVNQGWTSSEIDKASSLIARLNTIKIVYGDNDDKNKKHNYIVDSLHALFPSKTMKQENGSSSTHNVYKMGEHANENFAVREGEATIMNDNELSFGCAMGDMSIGEALLMVHTNKKEEEDTTMDDNGFSFRCALEGTKITNTEEARVMVDKNKMVVLENNIRNDRPVVAPHRRKSWTKEEHMLFLHGLQVYGRGDWKNISKHFVTTKTPVQVSSHAQKFFKRIEKKKSSGTKRYSINDVRLHDDDPLAVDNSSATQQVLSFTSLNNDSSFRLQPPTSSFAIMNNQTQLCSPYIYNQQVGPQPMGSAQQMMGSVAAVMDGVGTYVPDCQQGSACFYRGNV
ncbi:hypothetical protein VPH35_127439 [Triticum aestivum]